MKWKTKNDVEIEISELEDDHLVRIINFIHRRADKEIQVVSGGMGANGIPDWAEIDYYQGSDLIDKFYAETYPELITEAIVRKINVEKIYDFNITIKMLLKILGR